MDCAPWPGTVSIPGGPFVMGSEQGGRDERPVEVVEVTGYCLDRLERTAGALTTWMAATGRKPARDDSRTLGRKDRADRAATELSFDEAQAFCAAQGGRLPTEAEWEKAARGGCEFGEDKDSCDVGDARAWPWGDESPDCAHASHLDVQGRPGTGPPQVNPCTDGPEAPGSHPQNASPYGALDMAGNAWEWVSDWYHPAVYAPHRKDPGGPATGEAHVLRGGAWNTLATNLRVSNRFTSMMGGSASGVRCAFGGATEHAVDHPPELQLAALQGVVRRADGGALAGRAIEVSAFAVEDLDGAMPRPGASPVGEASLQPKGSAQAFSLSVPKGRYLVMAALDDRPPNPPDAPWSPPASSGGVGEVGPIEAGGTGLQIVLGPAPGGLP